MLADPRRLYDWAVSGENRNRNYLEVNDEHFLSPDYISINERLKSVGYVLR